MLMQINWHKCEKKGLNFWCANRDNNVDDRNKPMMHCVHHKYFGGIQQLRGQNFAIFDPPPPLSGQFLYPDCEQKQTFFDPLPLSSCPCSY